MISFANLIQKTQNLQRATLKNEKEQKSGFTSRRETLIDFQEGHAKDYVLFKPQKGLGSNIQHVSEGVVFLKDTGEQIIGQYKKKPTIRTSLIQSSSGKIAQSENLSETSPYDRSSEFKIRMSKKELQRLQQRQAQAQYQEIEVANNNNMQLASISLDMSQLESFDNN